MTKEQLAKLGIVIEGETVDGEELETLLTKHFGGLNDEIKKNKDLISKRNAEINALKDKEKEKLSEDEKTRLHYEELETTNKALLRKIDLSEKIAGYVELGYSKELATKVAEAELDGKSTVEFHKQFIEATKKSVEAEVLKRTPNPNLNDDKTVTTKEDVVKGGYEAMMKLKAENPEKYKEYFGSDEQ